jgi:hypothetical protein
MRGNTACVRLGSGGVVEHTDLSSIAWFLIMGPLGSLGVIPSYPKKRKQKLL